MASQADLQAAVDEATAKVTPLTDAASAAETLLTSLKKMLDDALATNGPPQAVIDAVKAVSATIGKNTEDLAAAVVANTPAAPPTP